MHAPFFGLHDDSITRTLLYELPCARLFLGADSACQREIMGGRRLRGDGDKDTAGMILLLLRIGVGQSKSTSCNSCLRTRVRAMLQVA
jgi:hypothetical protein